MYVASYLNLQYLLLISYITFRYINYTLNYFQLQIGELITFIILFFYIGVFNIVIDINRKYNSILVYEFSYFLCKLYY